MDQAIAHLEDEVDWHRRAGRLLFFFIVGALGAAGILIRDALNRSPWAWPDFIPAGISASLAIGAAIFFYRYYNQIRFLKSSIHSLIGLRIDDPSLRKYWMDTWTKGAQLRFLARDKKGH